MSKYSVTIDGKESSFTLLNAGTLHSVEHFTRKKAVASTSGKVTQLGDANQKEYVLKLTYFFFGEIVEKDFVYDSPEDFEGVIQSIKDAYACVLELGQGSPDSEYELVYEDE